MHTLVKKCKQGSKKGLTYALVITTLVWTCGFTAILPVVGATIVDGDLVKTTDSSAVYLIQGATKRVFPHANVYLSQGYPVNYSTVKTVTSSDLAGYTDGTAIPFRDGSLFRGTAVSLHGKDASAVFVVSDGKLRPIKSAEIYQALYNDANWNYVTWVPDDLLSKFNYALGSDVETSATKPNGSIVKYADSGAIYLIVDGAKRAFASWDAYVANRFDKSNAVVPILTVTETYTDGTSVTGAESSLVTPGEGATVVVVAGTLSVALASDTPAAGIAVQGAARLPFTKINLTAGGADVTVDNWVIKRTGLGQDAAFSSIDIIDVSTNLPINDTGKSFTSEHIANFTEDLVIPAGTTKSIILAGNMAADLSSYAGEAPILTLQSITLKGGATVSSALPISGNYQSPNATITIGKATVSRGAYTNATSSIQVGKTAYTFFSFKVVAGATEEIQFSQVKVYQKGTAGLTTDLKNLALYEEGTKIADGTVSGNYVIFSFTPQTIGKGKTKQYLVKADVASGSARVVELGIYRTTDLLVKGLTYGYNIIPTYSGTGSSTNNPVLLDNTFTISTGTLQIGRSNTIAAGNITVGSDQTIGAFEFEVKGEPVIISAVTLTIGSTTASTALDDVRAVKLVDASGNIVAGPTDLTAGASTVAFTDTFTVLVGTNVYKVVATLYASGGWATNDTIYARLATAASAVTAKGETTGLTITATPASDIDTSTQTVKAAKLVITKNSLPTSKTVITNSTDVLAGSWTFDATDSGEDVRVTSIAIAASGTRANNLTLYAGDTALSPINDAPTITDANRAAVGSGTSTFALTDPIIITKGTSKVINLKINVSSAATAGQSMKYGITDVTTTSANASVTAFGVTTGNSAAFTVTTNDGATLTVATAGTLTINADASQLASRQVVAGTTGVSLSEVRLKATNEAIDITQMKVEVADGALTGTDAGTYVQITKVYLKLDGTIIGSTAGYSLGSAVTTLSFARGDITIPEGSTGKKLSVIGDIVLIGINQPGVANADIKVGLRGANGFIGYGNGSNSSSITETYNDSTGTPIIIHKAVPQVVLETPTNKLGATAVLHRTKITAVGGAIGIYRLSYKTTTSTSVQLANEYITLAACTGCSGISDGTQLATTVATGTYLADGASTWTLPIALAQAGKYYLGISSGATASIDLYATVTLSTNADTVSTSLLGDTATTSGDTAGGKAAAQFTTLRQGNFVWSDLNLDDSNSAASLTSLQWYNGYYVQGLGSTTTSTPITVGE